MISMVDILRLKVLHPLHHIVLGEFRLQVLGDDCPSPDLPDPSPVDWPLGLLDLLHDLELVL